MKFKFLLVFFSTVMLVACGKPDTDLDDVQPAVAPKASSTAIFLTGGGGIDFGMLPITKGRGKNEQGIEISQSYVFQFVNKEVREVEEAVDSVLLSQGYVKQDASKEKEDLFDRYIRYFKDEQGVVFTFKKTASEGFTQETRLGIWHRL